MIAELGAPYTAFTVLLYLLVIADIVNIVIMFKKPVDERSNYCSHGINWVKVILSALFGVLIMMMVISGAFATLYVMTIQLVLSILLLVTQVVNIYLKARYGKSK